ncbi:hypothetical protein SAMN05442782_4072 [Streptomyces sp. OK228]|nr:hypothetical protein OK006_3410 [Actinobacteria bacterium OK006]SOE27287.1 hypothetical protein SAMN05442782_4072 [Streptomyces sp. OK228]
MTDVFGVSFGWRAPGTGVKVTPMTIQVAKLSDPAVRAFVTAVNAHDRAAFEAVLAPDATMSDDGADRDLADWTDREIFSSRGHMEVDNESNGGRALIARYSNDTWGEMKTRWSFTVDDGGRIIRFETGQA